jgi:hypothetical protein
VTAAGAVLDAASLVASTVERDATRRPNCSSAPATWRCAGWPPTSASHFDPDPRPDPYRITRDEFDQACERMARAGVPLKADRDQAWRDFAGWRVNDDQVLVALAGYAEAPPAPWSSDRAQPCDAPRW